MVALADVHEALDRVQDPELDESLIQLGFVADVRIFGAEVEVDLRLPTYFCAPNFAWVMTADAFERVAQVAGVDEVRVTLLDHMTGQEITEGVAAGKTFGETFPGLAEGDDLDELRDQFQRKAFVVRQEQLVTRLRASGLTLDQLGAMSYGDLPEEPGSDRYRELRAALGFATGPEAALLLRSDGRAVGPEDVRPWLAESRLTRVSVEGNADFCQGMLATRSVHDELHGSADRGLRPPPTTPFVPTGASR